MIKIRTFMKIAIRHGKAKVFEALPNKCCAELLTPEGVADILSKRMQIREIFNRNPIIYTSDQDRAIETALLLCKNGDELFVQARAHIVHQITEKGIQKAGGLWYVKNTPLQLPPNVIVNPALYEDFPPEIASQDDFIAVLHYDAAKRLNFELTYGEYAEIK